jgi:hypothetical protein
MACGDDASDSGDSVYVDLSASAGGDGTQDRPFLTVREGLDAVSPGGLVIVAPGRYEVPASHTFESDINILGSIQAPTQFEAAADEGRIRWQTSAGAKLFLRDLSFESALELSGGDAELLTISMRGIGPVLSLEDTNANATELVLEMESEGSGDDAGVMVVVRNSTMVWDQGSAVGAADRALVSESSTLELSGLALSGARRGSMQILDSSDVTASDLTLQDTSMAGFVLNSTLTLSSSQISRTLQPALLIGSGGSATVNDSNFEDCAPGFVAASVGSLDLVLERNQFIGSENDNCVTASSTSFVARDNLIDTCAGAGILVLGVQDIELRNNTIQDIHFDKLIGITASGIALNGVTGLVSANTIKDTLNAGISISNSVINIDANNIGPIGGAGVSYVDGPAAASIVNNNVISDAVGAGIIALGSTVNMAGNIVSRTKVSVDGFGDGIVFGSSAIVNATANILTDNLHNGILFLNGATGTVMGNTATGNAEFGVREICVGDANVVTVGTNTLSGNTLGDQTLCAP